MILFSPNPFQFNLRIRNRKHKRKAKTSDRNTTNLNYIVALHFFVERRNRNIILHPIYLKNDSAQEFLVGVIYDIWNFRIKLLQIVYIIDVHIVKANSIILLHTQILSNQKKSHTFLYDSTFFCIAIPSSLLDEQTPSFCQTI